MNNVVLLENLKVLFTIQKEKKKKNQEESSSLKSNK